MTDGATSTSSQGFGRWGVMPLVTPKDADKNSLAARSFSPSVMSATGFPMKASNGATSDWGTGFMGPHSTGAPFLAQLIRTPW
jgi:hypothetical protein